MKSNLSCHTNIVIEVRAFDERHSEVECEGYCSHAYNAPPIDHHAPNSHNQDPKKSKERGLDGEDRRPAHDDKCDKHLLEPDGVVYEIWRGLELSGGESFTIQIHYCKCVSKVITGEKQAGTRA